MSDEYQRGEDREWLQHSNDELARLVKHRGLQIKLWRVISLVLLGVLGWVVFKYRQQMPLDSLWRY